MITRFPLTTAMRAVLLIFLGTVSCAAYAELVVLEEAVETDALDIRFTSDRTGRIVAPLCEGCDPESLIITTHSLAFVGKRRVPIRDLTSYAESGVSVFYDARTRIVTRVVVWE